MNTIPSPKHDVQMMLDAIEQRIMNKLPHGINASSIEIKIDIRRCRSYVRVQLEPIDLAVSEL